nr:cell envelope integrity protein TolA [Shewanella sp. NIFS-20-20]
MVISAGLHITVIAILIIGVKFESKPPLPQPSSAPALQAVVVDQRQVTAHVEKLKQQELAEKRKEQERQNNLDRQARLAREERQREQQRIKQLQQERAKKEQETKQAQAQAEAAKLKQQQEKAKADKAEAVRIAKEAERKAAEAAALKAEQKRKEQEVAAAKAEAERKQQEAERKRQQEAERKRKAEEAARLEQENLMQQALAEEQAALSQTRNRQVMSEVQRFTAMIQATIQRNLVVNDSMRGKSCTVYLRLANDGYVTAIRTVGGDAVVCRATEAAINKAGRLPVSSQADVYEKMKEINLMVQPEFK